MALATMSVPLSAPSITEDDIAAVTDVLRSPTLAMGPRTDAFEHEVAASVGARYGIAVNSGTSGLHVALAAAGVTAGDVVITTPFSFIASANCAIYLGAIPHFVDIEEDTLGMNPDLIDSAISDRAKAIVPVDVFGQPCQIERIAEVARRHNLRLVEDSCEAIGAERLGIRAGSPRYADAAVFAFYPNKQITTGEGGLVVTDDEELAGVMRSLINQGRDASGTWLNHIRLGYNYRLDEMSAALGLSQFHRLDEILQRRAAVAAMYDERLTGIDGVRTPNIVPETTRMSWFVYVARFEPWVDRNALLENLMADGVPCRPYFVPIELQPYYRQHYGYHPGDFPVTERVGRSTLALPFFTAMTESQVDFVCDRIRAHVAGRV